ncbi:isochorismatase family protein [bacterium]|nr:isochorismatase family protein [bacterium]
MSKIKTALLICDLQGKTIKNLFNKSCVINNTNKFLYMKQFIPEISLTAISEFIPDKLGKTSTEINIENLNETDIIYNKTTYSMVNDKLLEELDKHEITNIILTGMEIQWCLNKTVTDLNHLKYKIYVPYDCIGNSLPFSHNKYNFKTLSNNGAQITTTDSVICNFLHSYDEKRSKEYFNLLKLEIERNKKHFFGNINNGQMDDDRRPE